MVQFSACCSPCQNPHDGKNKLTGGTPNKGKDRRTPTPAVTRALTPAATPVVAPLAASGSADSSIIRYLEDDLQPILMTVLNSRPPAPVPAHVVAAALHAKSPHERSLKARLPDIYWGETHLECYNFF